MHRSLAVVRICSGKQKIVGVVGETTVQTMRIAAETPLPIGVLSSFGYFIPSTEIFVVPNGNEIRQRAEDGTNSTARRANTTPFYLKRL